MAEVWTNEEKYWRDTYATRPYTQGRTFDALSGGYRYGVEAAERYPGRTWNEIEPDLRRGWETYQYRAQNAWEDIKDAVRDAWDRVTGRRAPTI